MRRRELSVMFGGMMLAWPRAVIAQGAANCPLVAVLVPGTAVNYLTRAAWRATDGVRELGYVEDENIVIEYHSAARVAACWRPGLPL